MSEMRSHMLSEAEVGIGGIEEVQELRNSGIVKTRYGRLPLD